jgi:autotransporter-associated beta strand protein
MSTTDSKPKIIMNTPVAAALRCSLIFLVSAVAYADSAQWNLNPPSGDWNTAANWTPATVPNGPADTATFALSNITDVSISADTEVNGIMFTPAATNPYSIDVDNESTLTLSGTGITNNSGIAQYFQTGTEALLQFLNKSTAGSAHIQNASVIYFRNTSTAGSAHILNVIGLEFFDSSTAGTATILNDEIGITEFLNTSTAGSATIFSDGYLNFGDSSNGGTARIEVFQLHGVLDIRAHNPPGVTIGSVEGDGNVFLGGNNLSVGSNNLSTTFSGVIVDSPLLTEIDSRTETYAHDGNVFQDPFKVSGAISSDRFVFQGSAVGGSLTKIGEGTLILSGANTYTSNTHVDGGVLQVDGSITSDTFVNPGGTLAGSGTVNGNITNRGGVISPGDATGVPGVLTVGGNYTTLASQIAGGILSIQIAGGNVGQVSVLDVQGVANLGGFLDPVLVNGFVPEIGQSFTFLNYASFTGFFRIRKPVFDHGRKRWLLTYNPTSAALTAVQNQHP